MTPIANGADAGGPRPRGRPPAMSAVALVERIRSLARAGHGLFRIDHTHPVLYARARRCFGSWAAAVTAAGLDYPSVVQEARARGEGRRRRRIGRRPGSRLGSMGAKR